MALGLIQNNNKSHCQLEVIIASDQLSENNKDLLRMLNNEFNNNNIDIGSVDLLINVDSSCRDYNRVWRTSTRKGQLIFNMNIQTTDEPSNFPESNGLLPTCDKIMMDLIMRIRENTVGWTND